MLRKYSFAAGTLLLLLIVTLSGCNGNVQNEFKSDGGAIKFDTARAAKSVIPVAQSVRLQQGFISTFGEIKKLIKDTGFIAKNFNMPNGEAFTKDAILLLLSQKEADGIRVYYGKDPNGAVRLILLPIRKDGSVIYNTLIAPAKTNADSSLNKVQSAAQAVETGQTCPPCLIDSNSPQ